MSEHTADEMALTVTTPGPVGQWDREQRDLIKKLIAPGIDDGNLALFGMICQRTGLDPFFRQVYMIQRGGKWTIQTGIDGYRLLAARTGQLAGIDDAIYDTESEPHPNKATVIVWRMVGGQRVPFTATARWSEYKPEKAPMWDKMPYLMLAKVAEALALRKAFPAELSGIYTSEEMAQADTPEVVPAPAQSASRKRSWSSLRLRALQCGMADTEERWADEVCDITGKNDPKAMTNADYDAVEQAIAEYEQAHAQAHAQAQQQSA